MRVDFSRIPLVKIITQFQLVFLDVSFRIYALLWILLLTLVGIYSYQSISKSVDSYNNPDKVLTIRPEASVSFPPLIFCASNTESTGFFPTSCYFAALGPGRGPIYGCDAVTMGITLSVYSEFYNHTCVIIRGVKELEGIDYTTAPDTKNNVNALQMTQETLPKGINTAQKVTNGGERPSEVDPLHLLQENQAKLTQPAIVELTQLGRRHGQALYAESVFVGSALANASAPSSQFQLYFDTNNNATQPFKNVLFHLVSSKHVKVKEGSNETVIQTVEVPSSVDGWTRLYPSRTEDIMLDLSTTTYLDGSTSKTYKQVLRPIPCVLPFGEDCTGKVSVHVRFSSLDIEHAEEEVTFDWLYVLGAIGGALTVAELTFLIFYPCLTYLFAGSSREKVESDKKDPLA
jgi:hypothetical protein